MLEPKILPKMGVGRWCLGEMVISVFVGDIAIQDTDAIVNAANEMLAPGSGISGAVHEAAGPHLENECQALGRCPPGEARITAGYNLKAQYVIHAVAPKYWDGTRGEAEVLRSAYSSIFETAVVNKISSLSIPAIGTGIYRFPLIEATQIAFGVASRYIDRLDIRFICYDRKAFDVYTEVGNRMGLL